MISIQPKINQKPTETLVASNDIKKSVKDTKSDEYSELIAVKSYKLPDSTIFPDLFNRCNIIKWKVLMYKTKFKINYV